jgi:hypothetical protein
MTFKPLLKKQKMADPKRNRMSNNDFMKDEVMCVGKEDKRGMKLYKSDDINPLRSSGNYMNHPL